MDLTKRQQEIFDFIKRYSAKYGYPPTVRDIGKAVGLASSSTVHAHLANLERIGLLRRDPTKPRAIELLDRAAAGVRSFVDPGCRSWARSRRASRCSPRRTSRSTSRRRRSPAARMAEYLLRVRGESMKDVGHPRGRPGRRQAAGHGQGRRHRGRAGRRGGDGEAVLPGVRPHPAAAGERVDGADPQPGRARARPGGGADEEHLVST